MTTMLGRHTTFSTVNALTSKLRKNVGNLLEIAQKLSNARITQSFTDINTNL